MTVERPPAKSPQTSTPNDRLQRLVEESNSIGTIVRRSAGWDVLAWLKAHPSIVDLAIATAVSTVLLLFEAADGGETGTTLDPVDVVVCAAATVLILLRRFAPLPVLIVAMSAAVWSMTLEDDQVVLRVAACMALFTVASTSTRTVAWTAGAACAAVLFISSALTDPGPLFGSENLQQIAWVAVATAAGDAVRSRRSYVLARQERAVAMKEHAQQRLEEEARRQVVEERLRIARELHDVIAHQIAVINVHTGVASHLLRTDPDGAEEALAHVRRGASSVLDELSGILSGMRRHNDVSADTDPLPTLDQLDGLIAGFTSIGFDVELQRDDGNQTVVPTVALAAYRIIQESLTNAYRHGGSSSAHLRIDHGSGTLMVEVLNALPDKPVTESRGYGIMGMRERIAAVDGTIQVGPTADGQFRVFATMPLTGERK